MGAYYSIGSCRHLPQGKDSTEGCSSKRIHFCSPTSPTKATKSVRVSSELGYLSHVLIWQDVDNVLFGGNSWLDFATF